MKDLVSGIHAVDGVCGAAVYSLDGACIERRVERRHDALLDPLVRDLLSLLDDSAETRDHGDGPSQATETLRLGFEKGWMVARQMAQHLIVVLAEPEVDQTALEVSIQVAAFLLSAREEEDEIPPADDDSDATAAGLARRRDTAKLQLVSPEATRVDIHPLLECFERHLEGQAATLLLDEMEAIGCDDMTLPAERLPRLVLTLCRHVPVSQVKTFLAEADELVSDAASQIDADQRVLRDAVHVLGRGLAALEDAVDRRPLQAGAGISMYGPQVTRIERKFSQRWARVARTSQSETTRRTIRTLGDGFLSLTRTYQTLLRELGRRVSLDQELQSARSVQQLLMPRSNMLMHRTLMLAGHSRPAASGDCSGDWWALHPLEDGRVRVVIGDVAGHGLGCTLITSAARAACDVARSLSGEQLSCGELLRVMNAALLPVVPGSLFMTCSVSIIDPTTRAVITANGGGLPPLRVRRRENGRHEIDQILAQGPALGVDEDPEYEEVTTTFEPDSLLLWYTDGLIECENPQREQFGERRLRRFLRSLDWNDAIKIRDRLVRQLARFRDQRAPDDDLTLIVCGQHPAYGHQTTRPRYEPR